MINYHNFLARNFQNQTEKSINYSIYNQELLSFFRTHYILFLMSLVEIGIT